MSRTFIHDRTLGSFDVPHQINEPERHAANSASQSGDLIDVPLKTVSLLISQIPTATSFNESQGYHDRMRKMASPPARPACPKQI
ncbi:hypothetical protein RSSM_01381 [Rhodopirellula sallentina SM41]|uniref:Uncharacterized protein n=1 Tax=Rhodopirellula sallentina SM41 TaxID=1263870 RepID=M5UMC3_9BACT|nr:hypothetical protein RSSM_01381 [Rhodopirellula sallentina SM41]